MNEYQQSNSRIKNESSQESVQEFLARISSPGYQSPLVSPDDSEFTPRQLMLGMAESLHGIAESLDAQPDYTDILEKITIAGERIADAIEEQNRLREEEGPQPTYKRSYPPKPPPTERGSSKSRTEASPGLRQLRKLESEAGE